MSTLETRIAEVVGGHTSRTEEHGTERPDGRYDWNDQLVCACGEWPDNAEAHRAHVTAALAPVIAEVYDDGRRAGVATHEHGKKGCFFDLANQPNPYRPS